MDLETQNQPLIPKPTPEITPGDLIPLGIIRTETVLSKLPVHNLAKKGRVDIQIIKLGPKGEVELRWEVSYSERYGQARQLAYKLDTIVIDQKIEEVGKPLPERLRLGSLREISEQLGISEGGRDIKSLRRAFMQNALAGITAKLRYKANDGTEHTFEAVFTRYTVIFTGQKFNDGSRADAVYIELHPRYREVLNNAPMRPLDLGYKKQLTPAAQRFYEIVSYKIFAALKYNQPVARLAYSEYCTFSAQQRYFDYDHFKKQMYKIHRPHLQSGYIVKIHYDQTEDEQGRTDWIMSYVPGPKARAEYATFTGKKLRPVDVTTELKETAKLVQQLPKEKTPTQGAEQGSNETLLRELTKRGIGDKRAAKLLENLAEEQPVMDQLEWGDSLVTQAPNGFRNPPGFLISLIEQNITVPENFETSRKRKLKEEAQKAREARLEEQSRLELAYAEYREEEIDRHIQSSVSEYELQQLTEAKRKQILPLCKNFAHSSPETFEKLVKGAVRGEIAKRVPFLTFKAYCEMQSRQPLLFTEVPGQGSGPSVQELQNEYEQFRETEAKKAIDALGMFERGERRKKVRMYLLNEHPDREHFAHMVADEQFEKFNEETEQFLIKEILPSLNLPSFEGWKQGRAEKVSPQKTAAHRA